MLTPDNTSPLSPDKEKELAERQRYNRNLLMRNWLNGIFMLMAVGAMAGLMLFSKSKEGLMACYAIGLLAVVIKMVEVVMRMPGLKK